jgi:hypothetical protein
VPSGSVDPFAFLAEPFAAFSARRFCNPAEMPVSSKYHLFFFVEREKDRPVWTRKGPSYSLEGIIKFFLVIYGFYGRLRATMVQGDGQDWCGYALATLVPDTPAAQTVGLETGQSTIKPFIPGYQVIC